MHVYVRICNCVYASWTDRLAPRRPANICWRPSSPGNVRNAFSSGKKAPAAGSASHPKPRICTKSKYTMDLEGI